MARKYAYHYFFRRMVPVKCVEPMEGKGAYRVVATSLEELMPGSDPGLDVLCDGILSGKPFCFPAETLEADVTS